ncbi:histidine kinase [Deinococcus koreensis]|uniref:Sensor histidine kinase n=1 Tax=Deinococcus koreensis TaxID=2054903 RepID=A0A2K3UYK4_9DEIO|nr:histidine kinase [Deinococcus koreensis]PNY81613.1 sensor histidine kinase [Deinococcus koreensis]
MPVSPPASAVLPDFFRLRWPRRLFPARLPEVVVPPDEGALDEIRRVIRLTGLVLWGALSLHSLLVEPIRDHLQRAEVLRWGVADLAFLAVFLLTIQRPVTPGARRLSLHLIALQTVLALVANALLRGSSIQAGLLIVVAGQLGLLLPWRPAVGWVLAQSGTLLWVLLTHWKHDLDAWAFSTGYLCFQLFAVTTAQTAVREVQARQALAAVVEELQATRALLSEASRQAERLQISRELHDLLGHHLTALGMNLQVAAHQLPASPARDHVLTAQGVAQQLLGDVRTAVRGMRDTASCDFPQELGRIVAGTPLQVHLKLADDLHLTCPITSQVLLRSVQEILTNAARHARARQVWLDVQRDGQSVHLRAHDDGHGKEASRLRFGCGLNGMRERLESLGGSLAVQARPGRGLSLHATLPLRRLT